MDEREEGGCEDTRREPRGEVVGDAITEQNIMHLASMAERKQGVA